MVPIFTSQRMSLNTPSPTPQRYERGPHGRVGGP